MFWAVPQETVFLSDLVWQYLFQGEGWKELLADRLVLLSLEFQREVVGNRKL